MHNLILCFWRVGTFFPSLSELILHSFLFVSFWLPNFFLPISFSLAISDADPFQLKERQKNSLPLIQLEYNQKISSDELIQLSAW